MKILIISLSFVVFSFYSNAQIITLFAGGGGGGDGTPAISASLTDPTSMSFDKYGNLYFTETGDNKVRKIDTSGIISLIAGTGRGGFSGDGGQATAAEIDEPNSVAIDSFGNVYFADLANNRVRKVDISSGIISTIAGNMSYYGGAGSYGGDGGPATLSSLNIPQYVCFDKFWNLYIADYGNYRVRKINTAGVISTVAGNGVLGATGDGGAATAAEMEPSTLCFDVFGNLYIGENGLALIKKMDTSGIVWAFAGDSSLYRYNGDGIAATAAHFDVGSIATDPIGRLFFTDVINYRVRMIDASGIIHTVACDGIDGYSGDGGPADSAETSNAVGIALDGCSNFYFTDANNGLIRKVTYSGPGIPLAVTISAPASAAIGSTVLLSASITGGCCGHADSVIWMNKGVTFATTTSNSVTYTKAMNTDSITAKTIGCGDTALSAVYVVTRNTTSISGNGTTNDEITCYPNPANSLLYISAGFDIKSLVITNIVGQVVLQPAPASGQPSAVDVAQLPSGVYFVRVNGLWTKRFVKE